MTDIHDWRDTKFVVVDVEGNGAQPADIVEVATVPIERGGRIGAPQEWLVRPLTPITRFATQLHGITNEMVNGAPSFEAVAEQVRQALDGQYLVAHGAQVEIAILTPKLAGWEPPGVADTLKLARRLLAGRGSFSLSALAADPDLHLNAPGDPHRPHRAAHDALLTARLFVYLATNGLGRHAALAELLSGRGSESDSRRGLGSVCQGDLF